MNWLGDLFSNPFTIPFICMGLIGILGLLSRSEKGRKIAKFCLTIFVFWIYYNLIETVFMPASGLDPGSTYYQGLQSLLYIIPIIYFVFKIK